MKYLCYIVMSKASFESCKNIVKIPFPGKYMVSSLTEYCVPGIARKH